MLPARAGMSPMRDVEVSDILSAPRTGGDEPRGGQVIAVDNSCSPHGRG